MHFKKIIAQIVGASAIVVMSSGSAYAALLNASFEDPDTPFGASGGTSGAPEYAGAPGWTDFGATFTVEDFVFGSTGAHEGNQMLKAFGISGVYQETAVVGGLSVVDATAWAASPSEDPMAAGRLAAGNIEWFDSPGVCTDDGGGGCVVSFGAALVGADAVLGEWSPIGVTGALAPATSTIARMVLITGDFISPGGGTALFDDATFTVTTIPVPAAVWLFGSGLLGLVGVARRRKA